MSRRHSERTVLQRSKQEVTKVVSLYKNGAKTQRYTHTFKIKKIKRLWHIYSIVPLWEDAVTR